MNNSINLLGRVVQNPVLKAIPAKETKVAEFSIAVKDYSKKGQAQDAIFFDIKAFNGQAEKVMSFITKGREVAIQGRVSVEQYKRHDGTSVVRYAVIMGGFHLCSGKPLSDSAAEASDDAGETDTAGDAESAA